MKFIKKILSKFFSRFNKKQEEDKYKKLVKDIQESIKRIQDQKQKQLEMKKIKLDLDGEFMHIND